MESLEEVLESEEEDSASEEALTDEDSADQDEDIENDDDAEPVSEDVEEPEPSEETAELAQAADDEPAEATEQPAAEEPAAAEETAVAEEPETTEDGTSTEPAALLEDTPENIEEDQAEQTESEEETEDEEIQLLQDEEDYDPSFTVSPQQINQRDLEFSGLFISGDGLEPNSVWTVTVTDEQVATLTADEDGWLSGDALMVLDAGEYALRLNNGELVFDFPLTVTEGGYNPTFFLDDESVSQWQLATQGLGMTGHGFSANSTVTVVIGGTVMGEFVTDEYGEFEGVLTGGLVSGEHEIEVVSSAGTPAQEWGTTLTVYDDDDYYEEIDPAAWSNREVVTEAELNDSPILLWGAGFPGGDAVDLLINGEFVTSVVASSDFGSAGEVEGELSGPLEPGEYTVTWRHPAGSASVTFIVVPDEPGNAAPTGEYAGSSVQSSAGGRELDDPIDFDFSFDIDADGNITNLATEYWWVCAVGGFQGSGYGDLTDIPETQLTVDRPFEIHWGDDVSNDYVLRGVISADGSASGTGAVTSDVCGTGRFTWSASADGVVAPDPEPTEEPEPSPEPTEEPEPTPDPEPTEEPEPSEDPGPTTEPEPTEEPTQDPSDPAPSDDPSESAPAEGHDDDADSGDDSTGGITAPAEAAAGSETTITGGGGGDSNDDESAANSDSDGAPSSDDSSEADQDTTTSGETDTDSTSDDEGLAATGTTTALVAIGAGLLMLLGAATLSITRRRTG